MYQTTFDLTSEFIVDGFTIPYGFKTPECLQLPMWEEAVFLGGDETHGTFRLNL